jgi:hypothetical protein
LSSGKSVAACGSSVHQGQFEVGSASDFAAQMGHFGTCGSESWLFLWTFWHLAQQHPHKMRLGRYFSTVRWYKIADTAGKS